MLLLIILAVIVAAIDALCIIIVPFNKLDFKENETKNEEQNGTF